MGIILHSISRYISSHSRGKTKPFHPIDEYVCKLSRISKYLSHTHDLRALMNEHIYIDV